MLMMFSLLTTVGAGISGLLGYVIFGPLTFKQLSDRKRRIGSHPFSPTFLRWILAGGYRTDNDPAVSGLAAPARLLLICGLLGGIGTAILVPFSPLWR